MYLVWFYLAFAPQSVSWHLCEDGACRVPVVYDSFASLYGIVEDGVSGRIVRAFRRKEFVEALDSLMRDETLRKRLQRGAMAKAAEYALPAITKRWYGLFDGV